MSLDDLEPHYRMIPRERMPEVPRRPVHVVLDNLRSAFNVGSIFRTADAGAVAHVHLCGMTAAPPNTKLAKTALGSFDYVPWTYHRRTGEALDVLADQGVAIAAVETVSKAANVFAYDWPRPVALVFGNEVTGIGEETLNRADVVTAIPMGGLKNSINVATAFGVVMYEVLRSWGELAAS
jgi:tRNA G18 (ribose-2'-O)-methylase SpoU